MVTLNGGILHRISQFKVYEMVKDVHVVLGKQKSIGKKIEEDDMWKK
jgi:hypothetical protein